jgi:hypothetical protein
MTNYASITLLSDNFYDKAYIDNQISGLVTTDYLNLKYTNSVDLSTNYYNKTEVDTQLTNYYTTTYLDDWIAAELYVLENNFTNYYNKTETDSLLNNKVNASSAVISNSLTINGTTDYALNVINTTSDHSDWWTIANFRQEVTGGGSFIKFDRIETANDWNMGTTNTNAFFIRQEISGTQTNMLRIYSTGNAVLTGSLTQNSDARLKDNVEDVELNDCMNMLQNINVKTYTRNDMEEGNKRIGFIAQDVKKYLPEKFDNIIRAITDEGEEELLTMDYARMVCVLWKVVQNQEQRIKQLEGR